MRRLVQRIRNLLSFCMVFLPYILLGDLNNGLVAWYPFDGNASDMSGNGNHGTVNGATLGMDRHGKQNNAYSFDGVNDKIEISGYKGITGNLARSVSCWFRGNQTNGQGGYLIRWGSDGAQKRWWCVFNNASSDGNPLGLRLSISHGYKVGTTNILSSNWYFFTVSMESNSNLSVVDLYLNGQTENPSHTFNPQVLVATGNLWDVNIGNDFNGSIDDIRIYDRALSASEVLALYNLEKPKIPLTDSNFQTAVNLWFSDEANAIATYGHISDWNTSAVTDMANAFKDRSTFNEDISGWDVSNVKTMRYMFYKASLFNQPIGDWNVSSVTSMQDMFREASVFNQPIGNWDVSKVTTTQYMFNRAVAFNQPIGDWNTSSVTNMSFMFYRASSFNQPLGNWNTSSVTNMQAMFFEASTFNQPIGEWNVSSVTSMQQMLRGAFSFNQPIGNWDVSAVTNMGVMFDGASSFNQDIGNWDTSAVRNFGYMFRRANAFNQPIDDWNTSSLTNTGYMFSGNTAFNQDLSDWNISSVTFISGMFNGTPALSDVNKGLTHESYSFNPNWPYDWREFVVIDDSNFQTAVNLWFDNQAEANATYGHISDWNTSAVTDMTEAFMDRTNFNEDISSWDVSNVTTMVRIFYEASSFNQDISNWDISSVTNLNGAFRGADSFNQDIGIWNTSAVTEVNYLFAGAGSFNQNIGNWDISNVRSMKGIFRFTDSFNQDLSTWDTSSVTNMAHAFQLAQAFNQDLSDWNTSSVTDMTYIFENSSVLSATNKGEIHKAFLSNPNWPHDWRAYVLIDDSNFHSAVDLWFDNQAEANATYGHISDWNTSAVTDMTEAFKGRTEFNEDISNWDTSSVKKMIMMFSGCTVFNQSLAPWDLSSVTSTRQMFEDATSFNQPIGNWNVSSVETMHMMFDGADSFNQPLDDWNLSSARVLTWMFREAESFNQNIASWKLLPDVDLRGMFIRAPQFNQDISGLGISSDSNLTWMLDDTSSLSDDNKGKIHTAFSFNPTWPYDWSEFITDSNQTDSPTDYNQTQQTSPDHNETKPEVPADHNATQPPVVDGNKTTIPPAKDSNKTKIDPPKQELIVLEPMVATYGHQRDENGTIILYGKIRSDGNGTIDQAGFYIRTSMDGNDTILLTDNHSKDDSFSITYSSKGSFYFQAFARNEKGETLGTWKRVGATVHSYPIDGVVETGDGWSTSEWFGDFRYFENGWAYHYGLGWVYLSADGEDGIWLWRKEHGWLWSNQATWPFLWNHAIGDWTYLLIREKQDPVFFDYSTGQYGR